MERQVSIRLPARLLNEVDRRARRRQRPRADVIRAALTAYVELPDGVLHERPVERVRDLLGSVEGMPQPRYGTSRRARQRHSKEGPLGGARSDVELPAVSPNDFSRDVEAQAEPSRLRSAAVAATPSEWIEELVEKSLRDRVAVVVYVHLSPAILLETRLDGDRFGRVAVVDAVGDEIRKDLLEPIAVPRPEQRAATEFDAPRWVREAQLLDDRGERLAHLHGLGPDFQPAPETAARQIEDLFDHAKHACGARRHAVEHARRLRVVRRDRPLPEDRDGHVDRRKRIAKIVAEDGDEALLKFEGRPNGGMGLRILDGHRCSASEVFEEGERSLSV